MDISVRKFEGADGTSDFDCGNSQLNEYLKRYARQDERRMLGVTYVAVSCEELPCRVIGYFTLANTSIPRDGLPESMLKQIPKYQGLPAFLLGRIAVDKRFQGKQIGELLLSRCLEYCLVISKCSGARYVIADALLSAITWYERYNFRRVDSGETRESIKMLLDLKAVESAIDHRASQQPLN